MAGAAVCDGFINDLVNVQRIARTHFQFRCNPLHNSAGLRRGIRNNPLEVSCFPSPIDEIAPRCEAFARALGERYGADFCWILARSALACSMARVSCAQQRTLLT